MHYSSMDRRGLLKMGLALGLGATSYSLTGCSFGGTGTSEFTISTVGGSWGDSIKQDIAKPFAKKHDVSVKYDNRPNAQQVAALAGSPGNPPFDTIEVAGSLMGVAITKGLLEPLSDGIPNWHRIDEKFRNEYFAGRTLAPMGLAVSKESGITRDQIDEQGWAILTDSRIKGRVSVPAFDWQGQLWLNAVNSAYGGTPTSMDPGFELASNIMHKNGGVIMGSNDDGMKKLKSGELLAAPFWSGRTYELADQGAPLEFYYPQGWAVLAFGMVIPKGVSDIELARAFVNASLSEEVQLKMAEKFLYAPTDPSIELPDKLSRAKLSDAVLDKAAVVDWIEASKESKNALKRWNAEVLGG